MYLVRYTHIYAAFDGSSWNDAPRVTTVVNVTLGSSTMLLCHPPYANPPPEIVWTRNGTVVDASNANKYKVLPFVGDLIIGDVVAADIGSMYQCRVTNALTYSTEDSLVIYKLNQVG